MRHKVKPQLIATINQPREQLINSVLFLIRPLADRFHQRTTVLAQIDGSLNTSSRIGRRRKKLTKVVVVEVWKRILIHLPFPRVIGFELNVEAIVVGASICGLMDRWLAR